MSKTPSQAVTEAWRDPVLEPCACSQLRRTARAVSSLYDDFLAAAGVTVTQYAILTNVARAGTVSRTALAAQLGMERTTLTRNLRPLEREHWVTEKTGTDRREHLLSLSAAGRKRLEQAGAHWRAAQTAFLSTFGQERFAELRQLLTDAAAVSQTVRPARS